MKLQIACCVNNLVQHKYGHKLNELAADGVDISLEQCQSQCVGCRLQPAFMTGGKWIGLAPEDDFKEKVYTSAAAIG